VEQLALEEEISSQAWPAAVSRAARMAIRSKAREPKPAPPVSARASKPTMVFHDGKAEPKSQKDLATELTLEKQASESRLVAVLARQKSDSLLVGGAAAGSEATDTGADEARAEGTGRAAATSEAARNALPGTTETESLDVDEVVAALEAFDGDAGGAPAPMHEDGAATGRDGRGGDSGGEAGVTPLAECIDFDRPLSGALRKGLVRVIRCDFLLAQPDGWLLRRLQDLRGMDGALVEPHAAAALLGRADRSIIALSHCWLSKAHPDPFGQQLAAVRGYLQQLRERGSLPDDAAIFWDYGCLPQSPRTPEDTRIFRTALRVMAYVYASPLGTSVLQLRRVPPRPTQFDGCVLACELPPQSGAAQVRAALARFGPIEGIELDKEGGAASEATARFSSHEDARDAAAFDGYTDTLGAGAFVCLAYNDRPYHERGWCVAEEHYSTECMLLMHMPRSIPRPKIAYLTDEGIAKELIPEGRNSRDVNNKLKRTKFTGKGDREIVMQIYVQLKSRLIYYRRFEPNTSLQSFEPNRMP